MTDIQSRLIPTATMMKGETLGFEEEAYAIFYEVVESTSKLATRGVPIYCAYTTELANVKPPQLQNQVAIFPTRQGVLNLLKYLKLSHLIKEFYPKKTFDTDEPFFPVQLVRKIFEDPTAFLQIFDKRNCFKEPNEHESTKRAKFSVKDYKKQKHDFHTKVNIRIAMVGGMHRTGTSCFFFSGEDAVPNRELTIPRLSTQNNNVLLDIDPNMIINVAPPITVLVPKNFLYDDKYIRQCNAYSYHVEERKNRSITPTYKSLSLMILDSTKHKEIEDNMRYIDNHIFHCAAEQVIWYFLYASFENLQLIWQFIYFLFFFFFFFFLFLGLELLQTKKAGIIEKRSSTSP
jgi:hypothetical protein